RQLRVVLRLALCLLLVCLDGRGVGRRVRSPVSQSSPGTSACRRRRAGVYSRRVGRGGRPFHRETDRSVEAHLQLAEHVVHRGGLFLLLLRLIFLSDLVPDLSFGIPPS